MRRILSVVAPILAVTLSLIVHNSHCAAAATGIVGLDTSALAVRLPDKVTLIAITNAGSRLVAVGVHGVIIYSDDSGHSWKQSSVPVDVTLTAVRFSSVTNGWAIGHDGVILHTDDGGLHWKLQLDGFRANELTLAAAQAAVSGNDSAPGILHALARANHFVEDGPTKPFLSLLVTNDNQALVVGAYRLAMLTNDGGKTWSDWSLHIDDPLSHNLYDIERVGAEICIVGELSLVFCSTDGGGTFQQVTAPGVATLFGVLPTGEPRGILVFGVAGNAFSSEDAGNTWKKVDFNTGDNLTSGVVLRSGAILVTSESGRVFLSDDHARSFKPLPVILPMSLYDISQAPDGDVVLVGGGGVELIPQISISPN
jgi:photosystem II stability/assembly factor-like uncharacterized protein